MRVAHSIPFNSIACRQVDGGCLLVLPKPLSQFPKPLVVPSEPLLASSEPLVASSKPVVASSEPFGHDETRAVFMDYPHFHAEKLLHMLGGDNIRPPAGEYGPILEHHHTVGEQ